MPYVTLGELFTREELAKASGIRAEAGPDGFVARCAEEVVRPAIGRIDEATGQANDPVALARAMARIIARTPAARA